MRLIAYLRLSLILKEVLIAVHSLSNQPGPSLLDVYILFGAGKSISKKYIHWLYSRVIDWLVTNPASTSVLLGLFDQWIGTFA